MPGETKNKINHISIRDVDIQGAKTLLARDKEIALKDLKAGSNFQPSGDEDGPYDVFLAVEENRLVFRMQNNNGDDLPVLVLSIKPYKRLIKDYFLIVDSYDKAVADGKPSRIEAIDMGRRGIHNEGAELLRERLEDKIAMDMNTARRLFTLICALHADLPLMWR